MSSLPLLNSPLLLGATLLLQCALLQRIGVCPLSGHLHDARRVGVAAILLGMMTGATILLTSLLQYILLHPAGLEYFDTFVAILVAALCAQFTLLILQRRQIVLSTDRDNAALLLQISALASALTFNREDTSLPHSLQLAFIAAIAFALIYVALAALRARVESSDVPQPFRGTPIHLISAGLAALALMGFAGLV